MKRLHAYLTGLFLLGMSIPTFANVIIAGYTPPMPPEGWYDTNIKEVKFEKERDANGKIISLTHNVVKVICYNGSKDFLLVQFDREDFVAGAALVGAIGKKLSVYIRQNPINLYVQDFRIE